MNNHAPNHLFLPAAALTALGLITAAFAQTPLPIYEPFPASYTNAPNNGTTPVPADGPNNYPVRNLGNAPTDALWNLGNAAGGGSAVAVGGAAGLSYPGLWQTATPNIGLFVRTNNTTANRSRGISFPTNTTGKVYASFLLNVQNLPPPDASAWPWHSTPFHRLIAKLDAYATPGVNSSGSSFMAGVWLTTNGTVGLSKANNSAFAVETATPLPLGTTHLLVLRYTFDPSGDDEVALWVNPGSLGVAEGSVPAPTLTLTAGTDATALASFFLYHPASEAAAGFYFDELRIAHTWADVTPTSAPCFPPVISTSPTNQTINEGIGTLLSVTAGGSSPTLQWQVSTNGGATWADATNGIGPTSATYWTPPLAASDSGIKYRVVATVACSGATATSAVATITVTPTPATPVGVVVDDRFVDGVYNNLPYGISNSVWLAGASGSLDASSGEYLLATPPVGTANWLGFLVETNQPIYLAVGRSLKATVVFRGTGIVTNNGGLRVGLFDYADGGTRPAFDGFGNSTGGVGVRGYMVAINYGTNFTGNPFSLYARNNLNVADLMGSIVNFESLGGGPGGYVDAPAFQEGVDYTLELVVSRTSPTSVAFTTTATGGGTNWTHTRVDDTYRYPRFDCLAIRSTGNATSASQFRIAQLRAEVLQAAPAPEPLGVSLVGGNFTLTWANPAFTLQAASEVTGTYTNVPGASSPYTVPASEARKFYRLFWAP